MTPPVPGAAEISTVSIRPGVSVLSLLRHLNYKPWFALAEFVDNSLQSFLDNRTALAALHGDDVRCRVDIQLDQDEPARLTIRDNAAGIALADFGRAFRPAAIPPDRSGLSEFGMGLKSAASWFAPRWHVRTSARGEPIQRVVRFDIDRIVRDSIEELLVEHETAAELEHFTEVVLESLYKTPQGTTHRKIREHLASIFRLFIRTGELELRFNDEPLAFTQPPVLVAPHYRAPNGETKTWRKEIEFDFGLGLKVRGFAALRERASTTEAGFALFRRRRLIQGSGDEGYRPEFIFGHSNSYRYQRLFGELELEGFDVSHTKDGFRWDENEEVFLTLLKEVLDEPDMPLLDQAEGHRTRAARDQLQLAATAATQRTGDVIERDAPPVLDRLSSAPPSSEPSSQLADAPRISERVIHAELSGQRWTVVLEVTDDPAVGDWIELSDAIARRAGDAYAQSRAVGIRMSVAHPFTVRFGGRDGSQLEPLIRLAAALGLAEAAARGAGVRHAGTIRRNVNELLRDVLANP